MAANPNWPRWIFASVTDHFKAVAEDNELPFLVEGIEDRLSSKIREIDHAELRINGPFINEVSKDTFRTDVAVNILIQSYMTQQNAYNLMQNCGVMLEAMTTIAIYKHGNGVGDDGTLIGCLQLDNELNQSIGVHHFGQLEKNVRIRESILTAKYRMFLTP